MKLKNACLMGLALLGIWSCKKDDDGDGPMRVPPRLLSEVAAEDDEEIREYLSTHYYNYAEFMNPPEGFDFQIKISTIADGQDVTPLIDQIVPRKIKVSAFEFLLEGEKDVEHTYYYLEARAGEGNKPTIADSTFVKYEGTLLSGEVFDNVSTGVWWDNPTFQFPAAGGARAFRGVGEGVTNTAGGINSISNDDGTFEVEGFGVGMIVLPSGLATFNGSRGIISAYSPVIFKYQVLTTVQNTDHDGDGIPSLLEDVNSDGILVNDNTDKDQIANFQDTDDDGDGKPTREEIVLDEEDNFVSFLDTDGDGTPDHLDNDR